MIRSLLTYRQRIQRMAAVFVFTILLAASSLLLALHREWPAVMLVWPLFAIASIRWPAPTILVAGVLLRIGFSERLLHGSDHRVPGSLGAGAVWSWRTVRCRLQPDSTARCPVSVRTARADLVASGTRGLVRGRGRSRCNPCVEASPSNAGHVLGVGAISLARRRGRQRLFPCTTRPDVRHSPAQEPETRLRRSRGRRSA